MPTATEVQQQQGTRLDERPPWMSYESEMDARLEPELAAEVAAYAERRYDDRESSNQNKEMLAEEQELSELAAREYQWLKPEEYEDVGARIGRVMDHAEFISVLRKSGMNCWYTQHPHIDKAVLHVQRQDGLDPEIACWVQIGKMPELSIMNFDEHGAPLAERRRGWRTCLLQVILKGMLTEERADKVFGRPKQSQAFHRYNSTLQAYRNVGGSLGE